MPSTIFLVLPCYNEELVIDETARQLCELMGQLIDEGKISSKSRICFVNDGSKDKTWRHIVEACNKSYLFSGINLAGNVGHQNALMAGLMSVKELCDAVITLDADLQHDIKAIEKFVSLYDKGYEIVYGVRKSRYKEGFFKKITGDFFYKLMKGMGANIVYNHADYRLMGKKAINALSEYKEANLFLRGIIPMLGFKNTILEYEEQERFAGDSKYSIKKMFQLAENGITSLTTRPMHLIFMTGIGALVISVYMMLVKIVGNLKGKKKSLKSSTILIWLMGALQLLSLGVIGEYIGKIFIETKHRPAFFVDTFLYQDGEVAKNE